MKTIEVVTQEQRDRQEVARLVAEGRRVTDPELLRRIRERAEAVRQAALREFGVQDIGVGIIRELRDAE